MKIEQARKPIQWVCGESPESWRKGARMHLDDVPSWYVRETVSSHLIANILANIPANILADLIRKACKQILPGRTVMGMFPVEDLPVWS